MGRKMSDKSKLKLERGQGVGKDYQPYDVVQDFNSDGGHKRASGQKIDRTHHFFSDQELYFFYCCDMSDKVVDIREQYPLLPISETQEIAQSLNIAHPKNESGEDVVMKTDFRLTLDNGKDIIVTVKPSNNLNKRVIQKFEIERVYWERRKIDFFILTEKQLDPILINNLASLREAYNFESEHVSSFIDRFKTKIKNNKSSIGEAIKESAFQVKITYGEGRKIFDHLAAHKKITFNYKKAFTLQMKINEFKFPGI